MQREPIGRLAECVLRELELQRYAPISIVHLKQAFSRIEHFAVKKGEAFLSDDLIKDYFLSMYNWDVGSSVRASAHIVSQQRAIRMLVCYEKSGCVPGRISQTKELPPRFQYHYDLYMLECANRGLSDATISSRSADIYNLLVAANDSITSLAEIDTGFLDQYLSTCYCRTPSAMSRVLSSLRCFFRSMFSNGVLDKDLSYFIPSASRYPTKRSQKLWSKEEVTLLLDTINRSDASGKRDYALILLMVRYGMRSGDILNLKLCDIDWKSLVIRFSQGKTATKNVLPILDDVGWALADWIVNARPKNTATTHVFTRLTAPYCGMKSLDHVFNKCKVNAGISKIRNTKAGPHSLRHALATNMLSELVPLEVITAVLGHVTSTSTKIYLHSDIEGLRLCALDVGEGF